MEHAPVIVLFWYCSIGDLILMTVSMVTALILLRKPKEEQTKKKRFLGKLALAFSILCAIPILLVAGYILYLYLS